MDCFQTIAALKHELKDLRDKFKTAAELTLASDARLAQQSLLINSLQQRLQNRITVTDNFLRQLQHVEDDNAEGVAQQRLSDMT